MRRKSLLALLALSFLLPACSSGNVRAPDSYAKVTPPPVAIPYYNPYAVYGSANATWRPPVYDRNGTVVKPVDPATQASRPDYEQAPWATGASGGSVSAPAGTF